VGRSDAVVLDRVIGRASARAFVDDHIAPAADDFDHAQAIPAEVLRRMADAGLWGLSVPEKFGGSGLDHLTLGHIHEEVGRGCSSVRSLLTVHGMVTGAIDRWGAPALRRRWLPDLAAGTMIGAFCLSEPAAGSDTAAITTTVRRRGADVVVDGCKRWITAGQVAGLLLVLARSADGMTAVLVPADAPGVTVTPIQDLLGTRASMLAEIRFDDVSAGPDAVLGPEGFAAATVMSGALDIGRYSVACGCVGLMQACLESAAAYASRRSSGGKLLRERQLVRAKLSDMVTAVRAGRLLCEEAGRLKDSRDEATVMATWIAKYYTSTAAARVASDAVQIHGASGCGPRSSVGRMYRDAKIAEIIEGSTELQQHTIAEEAFRGIHRPVAGVAGGND